jgi:hypothetical protein
MQQYNNAAVAKVKVKSLTNDNSIGRLQAADTTLTKFPKIRAKNESKVMVVLLSFGRVKRT